jgi:hypothetical protein
MAHLVETMAYAGQTPWHELGHALPAKQSIDVWAQAAGMDWRIQETPVRYLASDGDSGLSGLYAEPKEFPSKGAVPQRHASSAVGGGQSLPGGAAP